MHSNPGQLTVNISGNHIPQADIDANIINGQPIFNSFTYSNQTTAPTSEGDVPDVAELAILESLYAAAGGSSWTNKTGWPSDWTTVNSVDDLIGVYGLTISNHDVTHIDMPGNNLSGTLPDNLGDLQDLYYLQLNNNSLSGALPSSLGSMGKLQYVQLQNNGFSGGLPGEIGNAPLLKFLYLQSNDFSGSIPEGFGNLGSIERLFLQDNSLSGSIPPQLYQLPTLKQLDLAVNSLTGTLSSDMANLISLDKFVVSQNDLTGEIPSQIGALVNLKTLDLSYNNLSGPLPGSIGSLSKLEYMFLGANAFTGQIPSAFSNLTSVRYFYVEFNGLDGAIPDFITSYSDVVSFRFQGNQFTSFPDFTTHPDAGLMYVNISSNKIYSSFVDQNIDSGQPVFATYIYNNQSPETTLAKPDGLQVDEWTEQSITLSWTDIDGASGYLLERSTTSGTGFTQVAEVSANTTSHTDEGLQSDQEYYYRLMAEGGDQLTSMYSDEVQGKTSASLTTSTQLAQHVKFNGQLTSVHWKRYGDEHEKVYTYEYDEVNRLVGANYSEGEKVAGAWISVHSGGYSVHNLSYDHNGNIQTLTRQQQGKGGVEVMDHLTYAYSGNQLTGVADGGLPAGFYDGNINGTDYTYDENGNLISDANADIISIEYNEINLPKRIEKTTGEVIEYGYDAAGVKLYEIHYDAQNEVVGRKDYIGEFIFEDSVLKLIHHEEGRIVPDPVDPGYVYEYDLKDHLGNNRVTVSSKPVLLDFELFFEEYSANPDVVFFENVHPVITNNLMDHTDAGNLYTHSLMLDGAEGRRVGAIISLPVAKGDVISADVFAKYINPTSTTRGVVTSLATTLINGYLGTTGISNEFMSQTISSNYTGQDGSLIGTTGFQADETSPKGFINLLFLPTNKSISLDGQTFAYDQIDDSYEQPIGSAVNEDWDELSVNFEAPEEGYVIIYLSNEGTDLVNVHFDDLNITIDQQQVKQKDDYYPYGRAFNSFYRPGLSKNDFLFQGKELLAGTTFYDFHARPFDPFLGRFVLIDPQAHLMLDNSPYVGLMNSPVMYVDPDGELPFLALLAIGATVFGTTNVAVQAANGEIDNIWDGLEAFGSGAVAGAAITAGVTTGLGVPILGTVIKGAGIVYGGSLAVGTLSGLGDGIFNGDWDRLKNTGKLFTGNFYLDGNRNFLGQTLQGIGRFSWELPQTTIGHSVSQIRNSFGGTDRVDYFGGATFSTAENQETRNGVSIGNFINLNLRDEITGSFEDRVISDPIFMHEYGHTFDSQIFGSFYLPIVGLPSLISAASSRPLNGGISTHSIRWYERNANKHAARYFGKHYGVDWLNYEPPRGRYPRRRP